MMSQDQAWAKLKKDVRSLLLSSKLGLNVEELRKDYQAMLGHAMPLKYLGLSSILDMAQEMPDVVALSHLPDGSLLLKAICDESTRGIDQLISRQRLAKTKPKRGGYLRAFPHHRPPAPVIPPLLGRGGMTPTLPAQLRAQLRQLISQGPLRLLELESRFQQCFGHPLRFSDHGFYSLRDMLARVPELSIQHSRLGSVISLKQPDTPPPKSGPQSGPQSPRTGFIKPRAVEPIPTCSSSELNKPRPSDLLQPGPSSGPSQCGQGITQSSSAASCQSLDPIGHGSKWVPDNGPQPEDTTPPAPEQEGLLLEKLMFKLEAELRQNILENSEACCVSPELRSRLQEVVGEHSKGLSIHDLPTHYKRMFGEELPFLQCEFLSVTKLVAALRDVFHLEPAGGAQGRHWMVKNKNIKNSSSPSESAECGGEEGRWRGGGQYQSSLWDQHGEEEEEQPDATTCPVSSLAHQQPAQLYLAVQVRPGSRVPLDAVRGQRLSPPTRRWPRGLAAVLVEQVESPGSFHVRFSESQEARALEEMMMEMRGVYSCSGVAQRYRLARRYLRRGQVCCVAPRGLWFYRVVLQRLVSLLQAEVYYVDFGDLNLVSVDQLLFLKSCYSQLPAQAVPAALSRVQPVSGAWSAAATAAFQELSRDHPLVAVLQGYHSNALQLFLCDTHTAEDRYVHTVLVMQGHARPRPHPPADVGDALHRLCLGETLADLQEEEDTPIPVTHQPITGQHGQPSNPSSEQDPGQPGPPEPTDPKPTALPSSAGDLLAPPPLCNGNHDNTCTRPEEEPRPVMTPDPCRAPPTTLSSLPPIMTSLSLLTPGLAKGCFYGLGSLRSSGSSVCFPLFGGRGIGLANRKCD